jgi:hypothetical protein
MPRSGSLNPNWKGGRSISSGGYVLVRVGKNHPLADVRGYAYEHRLRLMEKLGRVPLPSELGHHEDETKDNNALPNIKPISRADHVRLHKPRLGTGSEFCKAGHFKDYTKPSGERVCRECRRAADRRRYDGNKK